MEVSIDLDALPTLKYADLRKLAKSVGIKANMKADKLVKALEDYAAKQRLDTGKVPEQKPATPKVLTPLRKAVGTPRVLTPIRSPLVKAATPRSVPRSRLSTPKVHTPLHRLRTPPSSRRNSSTLLTPSGSARKQATPNVASASRKRSRSAGGDGEAVSSAKKQRTENTPIEGRDVTTRRRRSRTNTYDKEDTKQTVSSPGTLDLIDSMSETLTEAERKEKLMAALDKKVQDKIGDEKQSTQIPRFVAFCALKKQQASVKKETPGQQRYQKAHARNFSKMDSLDQYLENKKKRLETLTGSAQKAKVMAAQTSSALKKLKSLTGDALSAKKIDAKAQLFKTPSHSGVPFCPQVTSVSKVNFNFSTTKTPGSVSKDSRRSPRLNVSINVSIKDKENKDKPFTAARQKSMGTSVTPFKFKANLNQSHNSSLNKSAHKAKFDLAASLNRPITWKPHVGKLKPLEPVKTFRKDVKAVKVTTKEERRQQMKANQAQKRKGAQMQRRGLAA